MAAPIFCPVCRSDRIIKHGSILGPKGRIQRYDCKACGKRFHPSLKEIPLVEGFFDIETSQAGRGAGNFGIMYSWAIKVGGKDQVYYDVLRERTLKDEARIVLSLVAALRRFDMIYTWYGTGHDFPVARSRSEAHHIPFPEYLELYHVDLYYIFRRLFKLHSNRLAAAAEFFGIEGKTPLDPSVWVDASFGKKSALRYILKHNIGDVQILEQVHKMIRPYYKGTKRSI